jgi:hypothetical protein
MTCSWRDNFFFNSNSLHFYLPRSNHNFPTIKELLPGNTLCLNGIVEIYDTLTINKNVRLGFILVNKNEYSPDMDYEQIISDKKNKKDFIWCDKPIILSNR